MNENTVFGNCKRCGGTITTCTCAKGMQELPMTDPQAVASGLAQGLEAKALREYLKSVEWAHFDGDGYGRCPECHEYGGDEIPDGAIPGHDPDCPMKEILATPPQEWERKAEALLEVPPLAKKFLCRVWDYWNDSRRAGERHQFPGHGHRVWGIWDDGEHAGKPCEDCHAMMDLFKALEPLWDIEAVRKLMKGEG